MHLPGTSKFDSVERKPYGGGSDVIVVICRHGDYSKIFKVGRTEQHGEKALREHYTAKHSGDTPKFSRR